MRLIKLKPEYKIQRKLGKSNKWEMTFWEDIETANSKYPDEIFREIKIYKSYEVLK